MPKPALVDYFYSLAQQHFPTAGITRNMIRKIASRRLYGWWRNIAHGTRPPKVFFFTEFRDKVAKANQPHGDARQLVLNWNSPAKPVRAAGNRS